MPNADTGTTTGGVRLGWVILHVADVATALAWYERAFGLTRRFIDPTGQYGELDTGATTLAMASHALAQGNLGAAAEPPGLRPAGMEIALVCDHLEATWVRALAAGAEPVQAPRRQPWGQQVGWVRSPEGALIELCEPVPAPEPAQD